MGMSVKMAAADRTPQKMKGNPGFRPARLFPRGGEITVPSWEMDKTIPIAVPKSFGPTPSVSNSMVTIIAIKPSMKIPESIIKTQTRIPPAKGNRPKQIRVTTRADIKMAFLEPILSDNADKGTTQIVLVP